MRSARPVPPGGHTLETAEEIPHEGSPGRSAETDLAGDRPVRLPCPSPRSLRLIADRSFAHPRCGQTLRGGTRPGPTQSANGGDDTSSAPPPVPPSRRHGHCRCEPSVICRRSTEPVSAADLSRCTGHRQGRASVQRSRAMLSWAITFLIIALIAAVLGFGGMAGAAASAAKICFVVFLIL